MVLSPQQPDTDALIQQPGSSFQQQGQFDWFSLAKLTISWTVSVFSRLSAAGVDPYTVLVAQNMCKLFKLAAVGRKNLNGALKELPSFGSLSDTVWFGIGTRHLVRDLAVTEQGTLCLGICAALSSCYSEAVAAEVLTELISIGKAPVELTPSISEWSNLVHACNGVLHVSTFPVHAERLMSLFPIMRPFSTTENSGPDCSTPASIAEALLAIGDVSRDAVIAITISGGADAGWLAAVAEWFFGLHVRILDARGNALYTSEPWGNINANIQILILYKTATQGISAGEHSSTEIQCLEKIFHLHEASQLFLGASMPPSIGENTMARASGRVPWETALSQPFRPEATSLLRMPDIVGLGLGCVARVLTAIAHNENNIYEAIWQEPDSLHRWSRHGDSSHGKGFVSNMVYWFPELENLQDKMQEGVRMTYLDAKSHYETQLSLIQNSCLCNFCRSNFKRDSRGTGYCKVLIFETIVQLSQILSVVSVDKRLCLKRHGIESLYEGILYKRLSTSGGLMHEIHGVINHGIVQYSVGQLQSVALEIFAGEAPEKPISRLGTPAFSQAGICAYLDILREVSDSKELAGMVHITPGRIEYCGRPYDFLQDGQPLGVDMHGTYRHSGESNPERLRRLELHIRNLPVYEKPTMRVKQLVNGLQIWYEINGREFSDAIVVQPEKLSVAIANARGFICCPGHDCPRVSEEAEDCQQDKTTTIEMLGKTIHIIKGKQMSRCLALNGTGCEYELLLRNGECMQCCVRAALASPRNRILIVSE